MSKIFIVYGAIMIILGIVTWIATYKYILPIGSVFLIIGGLYVIFHYSHRTGASAPTYGKINEVNRNEKNK